VVREKNRSSIGVRRQAYSAVAKIFLLTVGRWTGYFRSAAVWC